MQGRAVCRNLFTSSSNWKSVYIFYILKVQRRDRCAGWWIDPNRNMNEEEGLDIAGTEHWNTYFMSFLWTHLYKINFNVMQQNAMLLVDQYVVGLPLIGWLFSTTAWSYAFTWFAKLYGDVVTTCTFVLLSRTNTWIIIELKNVLQCKWVPNIVYTTFN